MGFKTGPDGFLAVKRLAQMDFKLQSFWGCSLPSARAAAGIREPTRLRNFLLAAFFLAGCSRPLPSPSPAPTYKPVKMEAKVAESECRFACDVWRAQPFKAENLLISPAGLDAGLSLLAEGARGQTAEELLKALHVSSAASIQEGVLSLSPTLKSAQRLFVRSGVTVRDRFRSSGREC